MKKLFSALFIFVLLAACQKPSFSDDPVLTGITDSTFTSADSVFYEVLTTDPKGWYGMWQKPDGMVDATPLDSGTFGSPVYMRSGWRIGFKMPAKPFQALLSVWNASYSGKITLNVYKNGALFKSVESTVNWGHAKLLTDISNDTLVPTSDTPVLSYEVQETGNTSPNHPDGWVGQWTTENGIRSSINTQMELNFPIPSGWRYTFKPTKLPFTMQMSFGPYTQSAATIQARFYVNGQLVKTAQTNEWLYKMEYTVQ